jgi:cation:H+ antiporter
LILNIVLSVVGFALLIKCADFFVDGATSFAKHLKIPTAVIGLTIVAFGTSAPELAISFSSHLSGNTDIFFGSIVGSSLANILVILGIAIVVVPFKIEKDSIEIEAPLLLLITAVFSVLLMDNLIDGAEVLTLSRADGIVLLLVFGAFVFYLIRKMKNKDNEVNTHIQAKYKIPLAVVMIVLGLAGVILGSELLVNNVAEFAESVGVSQKIISVTIIAIGTSLPELVIIINSLKKGDTGIAVGSIVGSNIFNICIVLGLPVVILGGVSTTAFGTVDFVFMILSVVILWLFELTGRKLRRIEGSMMLAVYGVYLAFIFLM